jgi:hypothetical protein
MAGKMRDWWRNCDVEQDDEEVRAIDAIEDSIAPLDEETKRIRRLITSLESCHHKAARWVELIIEAIGKGRTTKGAGTRPPGKREPIEQVWQNCAAALVAWCAGCPAEAIGLDVGGIPARELIAHVGERTPLKEWQVGRIVDKVREYIVWPRAYEDPTFGYAAIVEHPELYEEHADFRDATMQTIIHDTVDGEPAEISLAAAIDHLQPCNWNLLENLVIVLRAIGGHLLPEMPFAAHARNIKLTPIRDSMKLVADTLRAFCGGTASGVDAGVLRVLGDRTPVKQWLAASLGKTIRLQLDL